MPRCRFLIPGLLALAGTLPAAQAITGGDRYEVIDLEVIRAFVPRGQGAALAPALGRAVAAYRTMARDAGYAQPPHLELVLSDDSDFHNGFSTVAPLPLSLVWQAPAPPESGIFDGADPLHRTLIHEFTHHLSNERTVDPVRRIARGVFGRVMPSDYLSLLVFLATTPGHVLQPPFWHEGLAQWAETAYADPASPWAGRGRDPLVHMVWRLDAAAGGIPDEADWRLSWHTWPFGNRAYLYGLAYTRWLAARVGDRADLWAISLAQSDGLPFSFDREASGLLGRTHGDLLVEARRDLLAEQQAALAVIRSATVTATPRLTRPGIEVATPAWLTDGRIAVAIDPEDRPRRLIAVAADGSLETLEDDVLSGGLTRTMADGGLVLQQGRFDWVGHRRVGIAIRTAGGELIEVDRVRLGMPDARPATTGWEVVAVDLRPGATTALVRGLVDADGGWAGESVLPTRGLPWSPALRPGGDDLCWVETDADGSRLVLGNLADPAARRVLWTARGRILHPAWTADGARIVVASDATGVANAWVVDATTSTATALTNVTGGIIAAVPSPDGRELAVVDHDHQGPYLARIPFPANPAAPPAIAAAWPAPGAPAAPRAAERPLTDPPVAVPAAEPYHGFPLIRPRYWTPTTAVTPYGGIGVAAVATDPLSTHQVVASAGVAEEGNAVGRFLYAYTGWPIQVGILAQRNELTWDSSFDPFDYTETVTGAALLVGRRVGYFDFSRFTAYLAFGQDHRSPDDSDEDLADPSAPLPAYAGDDRYIEAVVGIDTRQAYAADYAPRDGFGIQGSIRRIGFGGDRDGWRAQVDGVAAWAPIPSIGHQLVLGGSLGWSREDNDWLQGEFGIGGDPALTLPRGYDEAVATGDRLLGWSAAWRAPLWRPFKGVSTTPLRVRQVVAEAFAEGARVGNGRLAEDGPWYRAVGGEVRANLEFSIIDLNPGLGVARQIDGDEDTVGYLTMDFRW